MSKLEKIITEIKQLEQELLQELQKKQDEYLYIIDGKRVKFEAETRRYHRTLATKIHTYFANASITNILTLPIIWFCLVPALFLDIVVSFYHTICFRIYGIPRVRRSDYIVIDHQNLEYLNWIEKVNCVFCSYFNGLIAWVQEIAARTEQYWCPIKHARKLSTIHSRYHKFLAYGDSENYQKTLQQVRRDFEDIKHSA
ncbi:MAG: hypothetical protein OER98_11125 [Gammaproteobacteria bacterium]|nr:hypothetical protein [Gammaproteobacteria bacterium]